MDAIKIGDIAKWNKADARLLVFAGRGARRIRLHINSPSVAVLWLESEDGDDDSAQFLARVEGYKVVEFHALGTVRVSIEGADVWWKCTEAEPTAVKIVDPVVFTRIIERRHRNPEVEMMMHMMQQNIERRLSAQQTEMEQYLARREQQLAAAAAVVAPTPDGTGSETVQPQVPPAAPEPSTPAGENAGV